MHVTRTQSCSTVRRDPIGSGKTSLKRLFDHACISQHKMMKKRVLFRGNKNNLESKIIIMIPCVLIAKYSLIYHGSSKLVFTICEKVGKKRTEIYLKCYTVLSINF